MKVPKKKIEEPINDGWAAHVTTLFTTEVMEEDFHQARKLWKVMIKQEEGAQDRFVDIVVAHVSECEKDWIQQGVFSKLTSLYFTLFARQFSPFLQLYL